jgi:hypothetical protein
VELLEQRLETALEHFAQAERIAQQLGDNMILSSVYLSRAEIALLRGRYSEAAAQAQAAELAAAEIRYSLPLHSQMSLALVAAVCEGPAAARAKWPAPPYPPFRADKNVTLRGVQLLLRAVLGRADNAEAVELYHAWGSSLEQLIST